MRRTPRRGLLFVAVACAFTLGLACSAQASRTEVVLSWDDGAMDSFDDLVSGSVGQKVAVKFQAPEWALWVTEIHYFIGDFPYSDGTEPILSYVWKPDGGTPVLPGEPASVGVTSVAGYPDDAWLEVVLPEAVGITDGEQFPDRVFFAGLEWLHRLNPWIGEDYSDPVDHMSWRFNWSEWELREGRDTMIRVVVTDAWTSPVEPSTWTQIKELFR